MAYEGCKPSKTFAAFDSCVQSQVARRTDPFCKFHSRNNAQTFDRCVAMMKAVKVPPQPSK